MTSVSPGTQESKTGAARILVAEDEKDIRELVSFTLRIAGHKVWEARDGEEAIELAQEIIPDLILMDVRMPRKTGYEACEVMKQIDAIKDIPIVFLSAKGQEVEIQQGLKAGAVAYILKPFAPADLTARVQELLATLC
jgi:CheY-like chemotaxis protein